MMQLVDEYQLARAPPFRTLCPGQLRDVLVRARARLLPRGAVVFDEGQPAGCFHLLLSGTIRLVRLTANGDQIIVLHVPAGEMFGIGAPLGTAIRQETAVAANACLILSWPGDLWQAFADRYSGFLPATLLTVGARSDELSKRIVELSTKQVEQRIACALLRLVGQCGRKVERGIEIGFPLTRRHIADMTGSTMHSASRILSGWEKLRMIESARGRIVVNDPHRLLMLSLSADRTPAGRSLPMLAVDPRP